MTKTPGEIQPPKHLTKAARDAGKAFRQVDAQKAMTEHEIAQKAFSNNRERLKAERLAREAAGPPPLKTKAPKAKDEMMLPLNPLWTPEEDDELPSSILASKDIATIAQELNRTQKAIRRRASKLKLPLKVVELGLKAKAK
jgi:hypothetical protein